MMIDIFRTPQFSLTIPFEVLIDELRSYTMTLLDFNASIIRSRKMHCVD